MPPTETVAPTRERSGLKVLLRFLPFLWPEGRPGLKLRVVTAFVMVVASITLTASRITSGPIPSPGMTAIRFFMIYRR